MKSCPLIVTLILVCFSVVAAPVVANAAPAASNSSSTTYHLRPSGGGSSGNFGLGVMLGEPTGLSAKYWLSNAGAIDFGLTYAFGAYFALLADYLWHFPQAFASSGSHGSEFVPYIGVGAILFFNSQDHYAYDQFGNRVVYYHGYGGSSLGAGLRVPLGLEFLPRKAPLGVFAELVPGVGVVPGMFGFFQGDIGIRFYL